MAEGRAWSFRKPGSGYGAWLCGGRSHGPDIEGLDAARKVAILASYSAFIPE
ncbi:MAG: hypothetical protein ACLR2E_17145 [Lachnospiraceae bacterium]